MCTSFNSTQIRTFEKYQRLFKKLFIDKFINNFYNQVEYFPNKKMPEHIFEEAEHYTYYDNYYSDDYIEAKINNKYDIDMAEIHTTKIETHTDKDGNTTREEETIFHGLFSKIVIDKSINSKLEILPNRSLLRKNKLEMDSSEFEKNFDVSATNKIIAMQLLTADIMEDLIEFKNKTNMFYDVIINNNIIYLYFHCGPMFETNLSKHEIVNKQSLQRYFYMLNFTYNLSKKLIKLINETEI